MQVSFVFLMVSIGLVSSVFENALATCPDLPPAGVDNLLTQGKDPESYFQERLNSAGKASCRASLDSLKAKYYASLDAFTKRVSEFQKSRPRSLVDGRRIDEEEKTLLLLREKALSLMEECGFCQTRPMINKPVSIIAGGDTWYCSDGSCFLPEPQGLSRAEAYRKMADSLLHLRNYPLRDPLNHQNGKGSAPRSYTGFADLLDFTGLDAASGRLNLGMDAMPKGEPFYVYTSVKGPSIGPVLTAYYYVFKSQVSFDSNDDHFIFEFESVDPPGDFEAFQPDIAYISASGKRWVASVTHQLRDVRGRWYLDKSGYIRYTTHARFPVSVKFIEKLGRRILLDTLASVTERVLVEAK